MVLRAVTENASRRNIGLLLVGDGPRRLKLELGVRRMASAAVLPSLDNRHELARLMASADALVHGCEAETFCLVAAEAHASGIPMIVPDRGGAAAHVAMGAGIAYRACDRHALERAIDTFVAVRRELQSNAVDRASAVRTMDEHFAELFERYATLVPTPLPQSAPSVVRAGSAGVDLIPELALAPLAARSG
jgi:alpha-1,6-mannosyltransferase